ncbi:uncharacterized protein ACIQIH_001003 [Cyanocitta cristata]
MCRHRGSRGAAEEEEEEKEEEVEEEEGKEEEEEVAARRSPLPGLGRRRSRGGCCRRRCRRRRRSRCGLSGRREVERGAVRRRSEYEIGICLPLSSGINDGEGNTRAARRSRRPCMRTLAHTHTRVHTHIQIPICSHPTSGYFYRLSFVPHPSFLT